MGWLAPLALVVLCTAACASRPSPPTTVLNVRSEAVQPPTMAAAIGGRKFTGYVKIDRGDDDRLFIMPCVGLYRFTCNKAMATWHDGGRVGSAPCATVTLELDTEPSNFYLASGWTAAPVAARSLEILRQGTGFVPGIGGATTAAVTASPLMDSMTQSLYDGGFEVVGATTREACEALRPKDTRGRIDGRCQPAHLDIY
jgi:hypothetical protein